MTLQYDKFILVGFIMRLRGLRITSRLQHSELYYTIWDYDEEDISL